MPSLVLAACFSACRFLASFAFFCSRLRMSLVLSLVLSLGIFACQRLKPPNKYIHMNVHVMDRKRK